MTLRDGAFAGQVMKSGGVRLLGYGGSFVAAAVASSWLGPSDFGRFALGMAWAALLGSLALVGTDQLLLREISVDPARADALGRFVLRRVAAPTAAAVVVAIVVSVVQFHDIALSPFAGALVILLGWTLRQQSILWARVSFARATIGSLVLRPFLQAGLATALWIAIGRGDVRWALAAAGAAAAIVASVQQYLITRAMASVSGSTDNDLYDKAAWTKAANRFTVVDGTLLLHDYAFVILVGALASVRDVASFVIASRLAALATVPLTLVGGVLAPRLASAFASGEDRSIVQQVVTKATRFAVLISMTIAAGLAALHPFVLRLFGAAYRGVTDPLLVLLVAHLVNVACGPVSRMLLVSGHEGVVRSAVLHGTVLGIGMAIVLVPWLGATGGAIAAATPLVSWNLEMVSRVRRLLGIVAGPFATSRSAVASL
ncbi:MAG: hypothetical protein M3290_13510 [Actinomycetota bacterium]|nr:hypothetical protein [Actinomycetota bacterium]